MSQLRVNTIRHTGASSDAVTLASDGTCTAKITNNLSNRNLIINGAMQVAQRGTSSTTNGYGSVDRFAIENSGVDEAPTHAQADVASGTTPYSLGFRKALKITNGNQTSVGTSDFIIFSQAIEAQNIAQSGWNYTSSSSFITLSFWIKSSVAQDFKGYLSMEDGTERSYPYATGSLSADTWTKITKVIAGSSSPLLQADNNANKGFVFSLWPFIGTDYTDNSVTENAWMTFAGGTRTKDSASDWYEANDATLEITGVQLEVGSVATDFEHRSFAQELALCQRYFETTYDHGAAVGTASSSGPYYQRDGTASTVIRYYPISYKVRKRLPATHTFYRYATGAEGIVLDSTDKTAQHSLPGQSGFMFYCNNGGGLSHYGVHCHWTADAEL